MNILLGRVFVLMFVSPCCVNSLVMTTFDQLEQYFFLVYANGDMKTEVFLENAGTDLCHFIRQSRMFHIGDTSIDNESSSLNYTSFHSIGKNFEMEINQLQSKLFNEISYKSVKLNAVSCMDFTGQFRFFVVQGYIPNTAFLFIASKSGTPSSSDKFQLHYLIDESPKIVKLGHLHEKFIASYEYHDENTGFREEDALCFLKRFLKFRLCVAVADFLEDQHLTNHSKTRNTQKKYWQAYTDLSANYYRLPENDEEDCLFIEVTIPKQGYSEAFAMSYLHCEVKTNSLHKFYLSLNSRSKQSRVFVIVYNENSDIYEVKYEIHVPLLKNIDKYDILPENFDI